MLSCCVQSLFLVKMRVIVNSVLNTTAAVLSSPLSGLLDSP